LGVFFFFLLVFFVLAIIFFPRFAFVVPVAARADAGVYRPSRRVTTVK
jgi:hypothetical protein